jgi:G3E family GTPase
MRRTTTDRIPVTLLTGFLGSGKTTLVNRILSAQHHQRLAVIVNEFGDVNIDGRLVVGVEEDIIELSNGCICCTVRGDLVTTLHRLLKRRRRWWLRPARFDRILIEASGLASPGPAVQTLLIDAELSARLHLDGVVTLAHGRHIVRQLREHPEASEQIAYADRVVLNHCDQCESALLETAEEAIHACNPQAEVMRSSHASVAVSEVLDLRTWDAATWKLARAAARPEGARTTLHAHDTHADAQPHTCGVGTLTLRTRNPLDLQKLQLWLGFLTRRRTYEVMRLKGIVRCSQHSGALIVQGVYQWLEFRPGDEQEPDESLLVLIGRHLDRLEIDRGWTACQLKA